jgi:hypothetical protein
MNRKIIAALVAATLLLGGCGYFAAREEAPPPTSQELAESQLHAKRWLGTQFADVPIAPDFTLDYGASYVNVSAQGPRVADLRYVGRTPLTDVLNYVQEAMSRAGWRSISLTGVAIKTMRYVKGEEECVFVIHKENGESIMMVRLHPRL